MPGKSKPRPPAQRALDNALYDSRREAAGIARANVLVPISRIPELRSIAMEWRREAKLLFPADLPTAEQILRIHGVCRLLGVALPVEAFETHAAATQWLRDQEPSLKHTRFYRPPARSRPPRRRDSR